MRRAPDGARSRRPLPRDPVVTVAPVRRRPSALVAAGPGRAARARPERSTRRARWLRRSALTLLALLPLLALAWVLLVSSWLAVDRVEVRGTSRLSADEVRETAGVLPGTPLARVRPDDVADAVRTLPPVGDVQVRRSWPGTVQITVRERVVAAAVAENERAVLVDPGGVPFATAPTPPTGVVRLATDDPGPDDPATLAALQVVGALPEALRAQVTSVSASSPSDVVLGLHNGEQVVWGAPGDTQTKATAALVLLPKPGTVVDVSAPGVAVRR